MLSLSCNAKESAGSLMSLAPDLNTIPFQKKRQSSAVPEKSCFTEKLLM